MKQTVDRTARRTRTFTESVIREMTRVARVHDAVNLAQGMPDFPTPEGEAIPVRLGRAVTPAQLARLHAFWRQAVRTQPGRAFAYVDLRFDSQIVTREAEVRPAAAEAAALFTPHASPLLPPF